jgi:hypothetical protein
MTSTRSQARRLTAPLRCGEAQGQLSAGLCAMSVAGHRCSEEPRRVAAAATLCAVWSACDARPMSLPASTHRSTPEEHGLECRPNKATGVRRRARPSSRLR